MSHKSYHFGRCKLSHFAIAKDGFPPKRHKNFNSLCLELGSFFKTKLINYPILILGISVTRFNPTFPSESSEQHSRCPRIYAPCLDLFSFRNGTSSTFRPSAPGFLLPKVFSASISQYVQMKGKTAYRLQTMSQAHFLNTRNKLKPGLRRFSGPRSSVRYSFTHKRVSEVPRLKTMELQIPRLISSCLP